MLAELTWLAGRSYLVAGTVHIPVTKATAGRLASAIAEQVVTDAHGGVA